MKGNKKITYLLLIVVLGIWGKLIIGFFDFSEQVPSYSRNEIIDTEMKVVLEDTLSFKVTSFTRDPFLNQTSRLKRIDKPQNVVLDSGPSIKRKVPVSSNTDFPEIEYAGFVHRKKNDAKLLIVKINKQLERVREGSERDGIYFVSANRDSLQVQFNNERKWVKKSY